MRQTLDNTMTTQFINNKKVCALYDYIMDKNIEIKSDKGKHKLELLKLLSFGLVNMLHQEWWVTKQV